MAEYGTAVYGDATYGGVSSVTATTVGRELLPTRRWRFYLFESNLYDNDVHPVTGVATPGIHTFVSKLRRAKGREHAPQLNRGGSASFSLSLGDSDALKVVGYELVRCLVVFVEGRDGILRPYWSGPVYDVQVNTDGNSVTVSCVGWKVFLDNREWRQKAIFNNIDAGEIAKRALTTANNQIANDNMTTGTSDSAEDLLYGRGELDRLVSMYFTANFSTDPVPSQTWAVSGSSSMFMSSINKNANGVLVFHPQALDQPESYSPVDSSSLYQFRGIVNISQSSGTRWTRTAIDWYTSAKVYISTTTGALNDQLGVKEVADTHTSPGNASFCRAAIQINTGVNGRIDCYWDACYLSKTDVGLRPTPISLGTIDSPANPSGANRSRTYEEGQKIGPSLEELSEIESGFDFDIATREETINGGRTYMRRLDVRWGLVKTGTTIRGIGQDRPNVVFAIGWGPKNLRAIAERHDLSRMCNRFNARAPGRNARAQDVPAIEKYGLWENTESIADEGIKSEVLRGYAGAEVAYRARPIKFYDPSPFPISRAKRVPWIYEDYAVGDIVYLVVRQGAIRIGVDDGQRQAIRLFSMTISIDENDNETISSFETSLG